MYSFKKCGSERETPGCANVDVYNALMQHIYDKKKECQSKVKTMLEEMWTVGSNCIKKTLVCAKDF